MAPSFAVHRATVDVVPHGVEIPPVLQESVERHRGHLRDLVRTLRMAGFGDSQIESGVSAIVASYRAELLTAITSLREPAA